MRDSRPQITISSSQMKSIEKIWFFLELLETFLLELLGRVLLHSSRQFLLHSSRRNLLNLEGTNLLNRFHLGWWCFFCGLLTNRQNLWDKKKQIYLSLSLTLFVPFVQLKLSSSNKLQGLLLNPVWYYLITFWRWIKFDVIISSNS
jgi:hypothetical protein